MIENLERETGIEPAWYSRFKSLSAEGKIRGVTF
jgi:hypothetical protein